MNKIMHRIFSLALALLCTTVAFSQEIDTVNFLESNIPERQRELTKLVLDAKIKELTNAEEARQTYLEAIEIDKNCDACYYSISKLYARANMFEKAYEMAKKAYDIDSANYWYTLTYASLANQNRDFELSKTLYTKLLDKSKQKREAWLSLAITYNELNDPDKSISLLDSLESRFGQATDVSYLKHNIYLKQGDWDNAIKEAELLYQDNSDDERFLTLLADSYENKNMREKSMVYYDKAIVANPNFPPAIIGKAEAFRKTGEFENYFSTLNKMFVNKEINPSDKAEYLRLVMEIPSFSKHFIKNLDTLFAIGSSVHPTSPELKYIQAMYFSQTGRINESVSLLRTNISLNEKDESSWYMLTMIFSSMQKWSDLSDITQKATEIFPKNYVFYQSRAMALYNLKDIKTSISVLNKSLNIKEMDSLTRSSVLSFIGDLYGEQESIKKAFTNYKEALKYNPNNAMALNNYAYFLSLKGKSLELAYNMSKKSIEIEANNPSYLDTYAYILYKQKKYTEAKTYFRQAISAGGNEHAVVLEHYADTLYELGEYSVAEIYWSQALEKADCKNPQEIQKKLEKLKKKNY